ncbi:hypothetical protein Pst134EA_027996 [Puccinia striiformis f. sp. tritici]|uniref:hypothetical protein n=1 Tax=Puccinia striiformis f. sp. tritici TaxID=168172 RepID=UPI002008A945|nr:hypothetical protein Pst134EA_027996 [Puccinia striiformis f. sp. tritici]KAH9448702.1 hypothetical protein Pst134EA_027996 [Puccinia striiformis f. sp. tritici]
MVEWCVIKERLIGKHLSSLSAEKSAHFSFCDHELRINILLKYVSPICGKPLASGDINRHLDNEHFEISNPSKKKNSVETIQSTLNFRRKSSSSEDKNKTTSIKRPLPNTQDLSAHQLPPSSPIPTILASTPSESRKKSRLDPPSTSNDKPLAERVRPQKLEEFQGQPHLKIALQTIVTSGNSIILWGPSGSGKTTLARCLKNLLNEQQQQPETENHMRKKYDFYELSATEFSTSEWKKILDLYHLSATSTSTSSNTTSNRKIDSFYVKSSSSILNSQNIVPIIFIDEVQRLNKSQQDLFLPFIESGRIIMILATTENPSFRLTTPLQSRCRLLKLAKHDREDIKLILERAITIEKSSSSSSSIEVEIDSKMVDVLADLADGDARVALSNLEILLHALKLHPALNHQDLIKILGHKFLIYDRNGDNHYDLISALHKSIRGGDADAGLYWLARMLEGGEDPLYVARRLIRMASEDIGLSNPNALTQAVSAYQATQLLGMPECDCILAQVVVMLAESTKSVRTYKAYKKAKALVNALPSYPVPIHLRNAPTKMMSELGYGAEYKYEPDYAHPIYQGFMPPELVNPSTTVSGSTSDNQESIGYPFLNPRSKRIDQQTSSEDDNQGNDINHSDPQKDDQIPRQVLDNGSYQITSQSTDQSSCKEGTLIDLDLLRQWEKRFNRGKPWIGRDRLQQQQQ